MLIVNKINNLKKEKNIAILAHYYQSKEIQSIADYVGDSYYLSKIAKNLKNENILFCGVTFMAESAKILSPHKNILIPVEDAICPMAEMIEEKTLWKLKSENDAAIVCYINSSAQIKSLSDVCVTSSNALRVISALKEKNIIFVPDKNLGNYISKKLPNKNFIIHDGFCSVHDHIDSNYALSLKKSIDGSKIITHPECREELCNVSDFVGSTSEIIDFVLKDSASKYIICTEKGILYQLKLNNPEKQFYFPSEGQVCRSMKKTTLEDIYNSLLYDKHKVFIEENIRSKAYKSLIKMHELAR